MRLICTVSHSSASFFSLLLSYLLVISLCAPFALKSALAAPTDPVSRGTASSSPANADKKKGARRDNQLLVRFREDVSEQQKNALFGEKGARRTKRLKGRSRVEKLELQAGLDVDAIAGELSRNPIVELVEPNFLFSRDQVSAPGDPRFAEQWALHNTGSTGGQPGADIQAVSAWGTTTGAASTVIAVIDSGIDFTHPDLQNNQWMNTAEQENNQDDDNNGLTNDLHGWDWITNSGVIRDEHGHGTMIAGIIAAQGNNSVGITGVMWRASLMSLRVLDNTGTGDVADAVEAIDYATEHEARVINCSWGMESESLILKDAIERAGRAGVVVVNSAGNSGRDIESAPYYPSAFGLSNQISVASTDTFDRLTSWSNYGGTNVTVAAPGTDILTTKLGGGYTTVSGTSASTALVTGVAGLIKTKRWWLTAAGTRVAIVDGARQVAELTGKVSSGSIVSAAGALAAMQEPDPEPTPTPTPSPGGGGDTPPVTSEGAAGPNMPDLNEERDRGPSDPVAPSQIHSDLPCNDCTRCDGSCVGEIPEDPDFSTARTEPQNETGQPGVTLGSRNFNWSLPVLSLAGRSGLDLNLALTYNSLVWVKQGTSIKFDAERGQPTAGFRIGFPTIQQKYYNPIIGIFAYIMVTPSGGRVELRRVGTSNVYEATDGSTMQMTDNGAGGALVRTADGAQLTFEPSISDEMRCNQIKDSNGNFITITYNATGRVATVKDTLARVVTFNYDAGNYLTSISQTWGGTTHYWAKFYYGSLNIQTNFTGLNVVGPQNGTAIGVLNQVWLPDGTRFYFDYTSWGQVWKIRKHAGDDHQLSYTGYNLPGSAWLATSAQTDCPRFTQRRDSAENWTGVNGVPAEAITNYSVDSNGAWSQMITPDNVTYKELYGTTGWEKGLTKGTEVYFGGVKRKWTTTTWTQDETSLGYKKNPRPTEMTVEDEAGNKRKTKITYYPATSFNLPSEVFEYQVNATSGAETLLRKSHTDYNLSTTYISATRRIIGLPSMKVVYDGAGAVVSKVEYQYDEGGIYFVNQGTLTNHDSTNYGATFLAGRGNLTSVIRWDADFPTDAAKVVESNMGYNTAGSVILTRDALAHQTSISYTDTFSDTTKNSLNTLAYPTKVTDADGFYATTEYNYDMGATMKSSRPSSGTGAGITYEDLTFTYDTAGRPTRVTNLVNNAYTSWVYPTNNLLVQQYQTINGTTEAYSAQVLDGAGRVRGTATDHTFSGTTTSTYSGQYFIYDIMGRLWKQSNPTEMIPDATTGTWNPAGDDLSVGFKYTVQSYDWNGRPLVTTNTDATTREMTYGGCGCAGGEQVTTKDERGRQKRQSKDVLGRLVKVEELNFDATVYATTTHTYDTLDHLTQTNQAGQLRTFDYDGHGRLISRITPEQGTTSYTYNADDTVLKVTDARGASSTFTHNNRHLPTGITYGVVAGVAATPNVTFTYDSAGNRTSMTDGLGTATYHYDSMSRMDWEQRNFTGVTGIYKFSYTYNLAGELTSMTNPWAAQVGYGYDKVGRMTSVTGSGYFGVSSYIGSLSYRAFGGVKQASYSNGRTLSLNYDNRLRVTKRDVNGVLGYTYSYGGTYLNDNTGRVNYAHNLYDQTLDRSYDYDHVGRLVESHSGAEARAHTGQGPWGVYDGPYSQTYTYDQWGNLTHRQGWGGENASYTATFTNNRRSGSTYDAAGNVTSAGGQTFTYDATGQQATASVTNLQQAYDGDGLRVKKTENGVTTYYLRSSVLGRQVVAEISPGGTWKRGYVYAGSELLAIQDSGVYWTHQDPVTKSQRVTNSAGTVTSTIELDPWGGETNKSSNQAFQPHRFTSYERDGNQSDEAMFRRYNRWWSRFDQPDPYDGSYNLTDPQSFNRYAYVQNDPVNFVDPLGLCTFNIGINNSANLGDDELRAMRNEITRIFLAAKSFVVFNNSGAANGGSYSTTLLRTEPAGNTLASTNSWDGRIEGFGRIYIGALRNPSDTSFRLFAQHPTNLGTAAGRVAAHEVGHYLLQISNSQHTADGLMRAQFRNDRSLYRSYTAGSFLFSPEQAQKLKDLCPVEQGPVNMITTPILRPLLPRLGGPGGGGSGGGGIGGGVGTGGVGALAWLDAMARLGEGGYSEVLGYQLNPPR